MGPLSRFRVIAGALVVAATGLRLLGLGSQEIWADEAASFYKATAPGWFPGEAIVENTPPLYYLLLKGWLFVSGMSEFWLRLPSALAGAAFVALMILAGRTFFSARVGLWAGLIACSSPIHIYYSQEARAYAFALLALLAAYVLLWRALRRDRLADWGLFAGTLALASLTHFSIWVGLVPTLAMLALSPLGVEARRARAWRRYVACVASAAALCLPWYVASFAIRGGDLAGTDWVAEAWAQSPPALAIPRSLEAFTLGAQAGSLPIVLKQFATLEFPAALRVWGLVAFFALAVFAMLPAGDMALRIERLVRRKLLLVLWLLVPLAILWLGSLVKPIYAPGRYDMIAFPPVALWLGLGLAKLQSQPRRGALLAAVASVLLIVPVGAKLARYYSAPALGNARATADYLDARVRSGDAVVFTGLRGIPVIAHLAGAGYRWEDGACRRSVPPKGFACRMYPYETERSPAIYDTRRIDAEPASVSEDADALVAAAAEPGSAIWVVFEYARRSRGERGDRLELTQVDLFLMQELSKHGFGNDFGPDGGDALQIVRFARR